MIQYIYRYLNLEQGLWVNGGEDICESMQLTKNKLQELLPLRMKQLRRTYQIPNTPKDTANFMNYVELFGKSPKQLLLEALHSHKLVVYGEEKKHHGTY